MNRIQTHIAINEILSAARATGDQSVVDRAMRELCLNDLFFLLVYVLRRSDIDRDWLYERCREVADSPDGHLDLWAREHGKSSIITFGLTIQNILRDPEVTVGIFSHTRPIAKDFLCQIKREFEDNEGLKRLFQDVLYKDPKKESPKWSEDDGIIVRRKTNPKESTIEAWGLVDGQPTGKHFSILVYDDVVTLKSVTTPEMISKTTEALKLSYNLGVSGGRRRMIGTRYHYNDTWGEVERLGTAIVRKYPATDDGTEAGNPVFLSKKENDEKRRDMGPYVYGCQMLQDPVADKAMGFKREWISFWHADSWDHLNTYLLCDPAGEKKKDNDYTVMWVVGLGYDRNYYLIDGIRDRLNLTERTELLFYLHRKYLPLGVGYEKYGKDSDIAHIESQMEKMKHNFTITALGGSMPKNDRIRRLVPLFEQRRMFIPYRLDYVDREGKQVNLVESFINEEFCAFPVGIHDDMLDCLARITHQQDDWGPMFPDVVVEAKHFTQSERDFLIVTGAMQKDGSLAITIPD